MAFFKKNFVLCAAFGLAAVFPALPIQAQTITTIAGGGPASFIGNGGPATQAAIGGPDALAFDSQGNLYIADPNYLLVRKVNMTTGIITTVAGDGTLNPGYTGDGGPATLATLNYPAGLAIDSHDNIYIADYYNNAVRKVDAVTGVITTIAGDNTGLGGYSGDGGPATSALLLNPIGLTFDAAGNLYIADSSNAVVRKVDMVTGIITTVAGNHAVGYSGDGGPATLASLNTPEGVGFDSAGNLFISDAVGSVVREVASGTGLISTFAGNGTVGYSGDGGPATLASFEGEIGNVLAVCQGTVFMTDDMNNRVRAVNEATGIITTVAGTGVSGHTGDGGPATAAELSHPEFLALDKSGNLYIADYDYGYVRKVTGLCPPTPTPTPTNSPSSTPTPTSSPTDTSTKTPSPTPTNSPTPTPSPTPTNSPTITPTDTPSNTPTITPTDTPTNTPTITPTPTSTNTPTNSPTVTPTNSPTNSPTVTPTNTPTNTATKTPTPTITWTPTNSFTPTSTSTPTWGVQMGKQVSKTTAQSGDSLTYTIGVTVLGNTVNGVVVTDSLPANVSFVSLGTVGAGSATFNAALSLIGWTLPSPLFPGTYSMSYNTEVNPLVAAGTQIVNGAQLNCTGLANPLTSSVTVQVTGNYTIRVGVYNEAGELIKQLFAKQFSNGINSIDLKGDTITSLNGPNNLINIYHGGILLGTWDGRDSNGNPVSNGVYHIKMDSIDAYGVVTTVTQQAMVSRNLSKVSVNIYNEAGEVVKHLYALTDDSSATGITDVVLSSTQLSPGGTSAGPPRMVQILVQTSGTPVTLSWDGTSDSGMTVSNGLYQLTARWTNSQGGTTDITRGLVVTSSNEPSAGISVRPNVISNGLTQVTFENHSDQNLTLRGRVYNVAGELVAGFQGDPGTPQVVWNAQGVASGVYLAAVESINMNGGVTHRQIFKIIAIH